MLNRVKQVNRAEPSNELVSNVFIGPDALPLSAKLRHAGFSLVNEADVQNG